MKRFFYNKNFGKNKTLFSATRDGKKQAKEVLLKWYQQQPLIGQKIMSERRKQENKSHRKMRRMNLHPNNIRKQKKKRKTNHNNSKPRWKNFFYDTEEYSFAYKISRTDSYWHISLVKRHHKT